MNAPKNAATVFGSIAVVLSMIAMIAMIASMVVFNPNNNLRVFANSELPQQQSASPADQPSVAPFVEDGTKNGTFSRNRSLAPALASAKLTGIGNSSALPIIGLGHGSGDGTAAGPSFPSFLAADTVLLEDEFSRANSPVVGSPSVGGTWNELEQTGASVTIFNEKLFFEDTSDVTNLPLVKSSFNQASTGTLQWDFDFDWARTGNEGIYRVLMQLGDSTAMSDVSPDVGVGVNLIWTAIGGAQETLGSRKGGVNTARDGVSGPAHISVVANLDTKTYTLQVSGGTVHGGIPFDAVVPLDQVRFFTDNVNENNFSARTIDNVIVISSDGTPPVNTPPVAQDQSVSTGKDTPRQVTLTATDPVECQLVFSTVSGPANGSLGTIIDQPCVSGFPNSDSVTVEYTPNAGFTGSDSFTWQATVGLETSNIATVSITVTENTALLSDNFDRPDSLAVGQGWVEDEQAGASAEISANQLHFADASDLVNRPVVERAFPQVSAGTLQWDFDFNWARTGNEGTYRFLMQLGDSAAMSAASQDDGAAVNLLWTSINGDHQSLGYRNGGVNTALTVISGAANISVVANLDTNTYSVLVDGLVVDTGIPFDGNGPLNLVRFFTDSLNEANFSGRSIDNVEILSGSAGNFPPVAQDDALNTPVDTAFALMLVFTDPDGPGPYTFTIVTPPSNGVLSCTGADCTYTPNPGFTGDDSFDWSVNDNEAESNIATMTVTVLGGNVAPVAGDDFYATLNNTTLTVSQLDGVLADDTDANGDPLTAVLITPPLVTAGVLTAFNDDGSFIFDPADGFFGSVTFTYEADDGLLRSTTATVSIDVSPDLGGLNLQPVNGQTNVSVNPTLEINCVVEGTTAAQYQIATNSAFTTVVHDSGEDINDICSHRASAGLNASTTYFWRGMIKDDQGVWSPWSVPTSFTTVDATAIFANIFQDGVNGYDGAVDADIRGSAVDPTGPPIRPWNQGAQDVLRTGRRLPGQPTDEIFRSLLHWDVTGLSDSSAVVNAYIELTGWHHTRSNHLFHEYNSMYELNKPWGEGPNILEHVENPGEVTWIYTARPDEWDIPGAAFASDTDIDADRSETALVNRVSTNLEGIKSVWSSQNLVDAVKGWISDPGSNHGVLIKALDELSRQTLHTASRENPDINFRPKLVIESTESIGSQPNFAPVAQDQSASTGLNLPLALLLAYTDPGGPTPYTFTIVTPPGNGALTGSGANRTYTPDPDFFGSDSFTWQVEDGLNALSNLATFSIIVTETAPIVSDNFDRANSSDVGPDWTEIEQVGAAAAIANQKLHFADTSDVTNRPLVRRSFPLVSDGTLQWDFEFDWARTGNEGTYRFLMQLGDGNLMSDASQSDGAGVNLIWTSIGGTHQSLGYRQGGANTSLTVLSGPAVISVSADLNTHTYSVAVDALVVGTGIPFDSNVSVDTVRFFTDNLNEQNFSGRNIDNLNIFHLSTP